MRLCTAWTGPDNAKVLLPYNRLVSLLRELIGQNPSLQLDHRGPIV